MKLLSVIPTMNPLSGGPAQGIRNNIPFWKLFGLEANVLSLDNAESDYIVENNTIGIGSVKNNWSYSRKLIPYLLTNLHQYDVVLIHGLWQYHGYAVLKAINILKKKKLPIPKVYIMPHGMLDPYFQQAADRRLKAIRNKVYWHLIEKKGINNADGILFTCEEELKLAETTFSNYLPKATYNIGYGIIPPPDFTPLQQAAFLSNCKTLAGKPYFLFLSRIHTKKGVDILLQAYFACCQICKDENIIIPDLVVAGPGLETDYGKDLLLFVENKLEFKHKVHFSGMLQGDAKWGALYGAELFVLPSHQENFGIAIVEAMACKVPVLVTNKVNIWREIEKGGAGIITDDTVEATINAIIHWLQLPRDAQQLMQENAFETYKNNFTAEETSRKFIDIIKHHV